MGGLEQLLVRLLPPTIHPMIVHFPIALGFLLLLVEVAAFATRDPFWERAGIWLINLEILAIGAAIVAGVVSEHSAIVHGTSRALLSAHKRDGVLTGLLFGALWIVRMGFLTPRRHPAQKESKRASQARIVLRPLRPGIFSLVLLLGGLVMLTVTASLGGSLVYEHGVGVSGAAPAVGGAKGDPAGSNQAGTSVPLASSTSSSSSSGSGATSSGSPGSSGTSAGSSSLPSSPSASSSSSGNASAVAAGQQLWNQTCAMCHGQTPIFTAAWVNQVGAGNLTQFIAQAMPPGNPLPISKAKDLVTFLQAQ